MSVEDVPAVVNIKTLKKRLITHKFETGWFGGVERSLRSELHISDEDSCD